MIHRKRNHPSKHFNSHICSSNFFLDIPTDCAMIMQVKQHVFWLTKQPVIFFNYCIPAHNFFISANAKPTKEDTAPCSCHSFCFCWSFGAARIAPGDDPARSEIIWEVCPNPCVIPFITVANDYWWLVEVVSAAMCDTYIKKNMFLERPQITNQILLLMP